jgi:hypothetical protein
MTSMRGRRAPVPADAAAWGPEPLQMRALRRFSMINGLLLPGGGADLEPGHPFFDTARRLVDLAVKANDNGDYFPVRRPFFHSFVRSFVLSFSP